MMRIGIISPNLLVNIDHYNQMFDDERKQWPFDGMAKRVAFLFDKIFVADDLDLTYEVIGSLSGEFDEDESVRTLRYLEDQGFVVGLKDLGISSANDFVARNADGISAQLHSEVLRIGNPGIEDDQAELFVGQPDVGWFVAHDGWHPRRDRDVLLSLGIGEQETIYESLLLRRNMALLREARYQDAVVVGRHMNILRIERRRTQFGGSSLRKCLRWICEHRGMTSSVSEAKSTRSTSQGA